MEETGVLGESSYRVSGLLGNSLNPLQVSEKMVSAGLAKKQRRFSKLDLTAIILDKGLTSKAALLAYVQDHGTEEMQAFVHTNQKKLKEFLDEAAEWDRARSDARMEAETDWELVCRIAEGSCCHGEVCSYMEAVTAFFAANAASIFQNNLAAALRAIICSGPSKTTRVPLVTGPTNSGKTTLFLPFDEVFGFHRVFHKPALGSKFALRNILRDKRFLFFDDFRPVEYAQETLLVSTFLSLFQGQPLEVQVSQAFHDGNVDFEWHRGCLMTAKADGLWTPSGSVSPEDIRHMQSRVTVFAATSTISRLRDTLPCRRCLCYWVCESAKQHDAESALAAPLLQDPTRGAGDTSNIIGLESLAQRAYIPPGKLQQLRVDLLALGVVHVRELTEEDWRGLRCWPSLLPFEQRRLLAAQAETA